MRERAKREKKIAILCHICGTKPSIKPLITDRFKKPLSFTHLASSEFSLYFTEKTGPVTLTVFLIKLLGNYTGSDAMYSSVQCAIVFLIVSRRDPH